MEHQPVGKSAPLTCRSRPGWPAAAVLVAVLCAALPAVSQLAAATLLPMNLGDLCHRADRIFRGTVLAVKTGTVSAGGGEIPTVHFTIEVVEAFKGDFPESAGREIVEIRMLGKRKPACIGDLELRSPLPEMPRLTVGAEYLLFTTAPGPAGLSTTTGLGQGCFHLSGKPGHEQALNEYRNRGLFTGMAAPARTAAGPIPYAELAERIRSELEAPGTPGTLKSITGAGP